MSKDFYDYRSQMPVPAQKLFDWHKNPGAFNRLIPPWIKMDVLERTGGIEDGSRVVMMLHNAPFPIKWGLQHKDYQEGVQFSDYQVEGPFASWQHVHKVVADGPESSYLEDQVEYELPAGFAGELAGGGIVHSELERLFKYRHRILNQDLELPEHDRMRVLVTGSTGMIGSDLVHFLASQGHSVTRLLRPQSKQPGAGDSAAANIIWDHEREEAPLAQLERFDAIVHLAGDNIGSERWSEEKKQLLVASRVSYTKQLCAALKQLSDPPKVLVSASAIGYYGLDRGNAILTEESERGRGFLAELCQQWEDASKEIDPRTRAVNLRFGVVLSPKGGALAKMLPPFKMGAGGPLGSGEQYFSWIAIDDAVGAIYHVITHDELKGPVNAVAPNTVTNAEFTQALSRVLHRPAIMPMPLIAARTIFGQMADECLFASQKVLPEKIEASGYQFRNKEIASALSHVLGRS